MRLNHYFSTLSAILLLSFLTACSGNSENTSGSGQDVQMAHNHGGDGEIEIQRGAAAFNFQATEHDFGKVQLGDKAEHRFTFVNTGDEPLVIQDASAGCGCTVPDYSKEPIAPGEEGFVDVTYNSQGRPAQEFNQTVTLRANTSSGVETLRVRGEVVVGDGSASSETDAYGRTPDHPHYGHNHPSDDDDDRAPKNVSHDQDGPRLDFEYNEYDFGTIEDGDVVSTEFHFVNNGNETLIIDKVEATCGCTAPEYTDGPVAPGEKGFIKVQYDSNVREVTTFMQPVNISANTSIGMHQVIVKGKVNR